MNMTVVCAENKDFLYRQTRDWLVKQMRTGQLKPGSKLPGERALADILKISRCTARTALQALEDEGFIERIPSRGAFIKRRGEVRHVKLAFVFPEAEISLNYLAYPNMMANSMLQRGLMKASMENNASLSFLYCNHERCSGKDKTYAEQFCDRIMNEYDGAVFVSQQLAELREKLIDHNFPCINLSDVDLLPGEKTIIYNRGDICQKAAEYLVEAGCRQVVMVFQYGNSEKALAMKFNPVRDALGAAGTKLSRDDLLIVGAEEEDIYRELKSRYKNAGDLPDAFFCTTQLPCKALLHFADEMRLKVPDDFMIVGYGNSPEIVRYSAVNEISYVQIPYLEMGDAAGKLLIDNVLYGKEIPNVTMIEAKLIHARSKGLLNEELITGEVK